MATGARGADNMVDNSQIQDFAESVRFSGIPVEFIPTSGVIHNFWINGNANELAAHILKGVL